MSFQVSQLQGDAILLPQNPRNYRKPENMQLNYSGRFEETQGTLFLKQTVVDLRLAHLTCALKKTKIISN